jgi:murein DD-endopeptidase MepM/ murein hydrolase activator NlpD
VRHVRSLIRNWYGHLAGILTDWVRLAAPGALLAAYLGGKQPLDWLWAALMAPLAAALYAALYLLLRAIPVPLRRLKLVDTLLLAIAIGAAAGAVSGPSSRSLHVWLAVPGLLLFGAVWYINWWHEGLDARPGDGTIPPAPPFTPPAVGPVSAGYRSYDRSHTGVDLALPVGTPVRSPYDGRVDHAGPLGQWGYAVLLDHGSGWSTLYAHLDRVAVRKGQRVAQGEILGWSGTSGISTGPHLHLELRWGGRPVDPAPLLDGSNQDDSLRRCRR